MITLTRPLGDITVLSHDHHWNEWYSDWTDGLTMGNWWNDTGGESLIGIFESAGANVNMRGSMC